MKEYIERGTLLKELERFPHLQMAGGIVRSMPKEDVVEVKHEEWKLCKGSITYSCTYCDYKAFPREQEEWFFCPRCGAKMDGERKGQG